MLKNKLTDLSIIILNYNSGVYLQKCLESINKSKINKYKIEIIIADNASTDTSFQNIQTIKSTNKQISFKFLPIEKNLGFAAGNNRGLKVIDKDSKYVLFLNPDTVVESNTFAKMISFFEKNEKVDAATCFIKLAITGKLQPECHRGFPTPWRSFSYFTGLFKLFPKTNFFNGYFLGNLDTKKTHKIEACIGAFLMVKKNVGQEINWWNEKYFFYGEDLDFCYQLFKRGYNLYFYPFCKITHFQGVSSGLISKSKNISQASRQTKIKVALASTQAMKIFYQENLLKDYSLPMKSLVMSGIKILEFYRVSKAKYL